MNKKLKSKLQKAWREQKNFKTCGNCLLYNPEKQECRVVILNGGERINLPVVASDPCFFENKIASEDGCFTPVEDIKQVRFYAVDPDTGEISKTGKGEIKIEYEESFFGKSLDWVSPPEDDETEA